MDSFLNVYFLFQCFIFKTVILKPKQHLKKYDDTVQLAPNFIALGLHSQQELFGKNKSRKWNLE